MVKLQPGARCRLKGKFSEDKQDQPRARHAVKCSVMSVKGMSNMKPLKGLFVGGHFTEDRAVWNEERQRQCENVHDDKGETTEKQEERLCCTTRQKTYTSRMKGELLKSQSTWYFGQGPRWRKRKVDEPEDLVVTGMSKQLLQEKIYDITRRLMSKWYATGLI